MKILSLPNEVFDIILRFLNTEDLASLQATCMAFRQLLQSRLWYHVHISLSSITHDERFPVVQPALMQEYIAPYCQCGTKFMSNHNCMKSVMYLEPASIRQLGTMLLDGHTEVLKFVRILSFDTEYYLPTSILEPQTSQELKDLTDHAVINWFLKFISTRLPNLERCDIHTGLNKPAPTATRSIVQYLMAQLPSGVELNLDFDATRVWQDLRDRLGGLEYCNIKLFNLVLQYPDPTLHSTRLFFGRQLPASVEKFDLVERLDQYENNPGSAFENYTGIRAEVLRDFLLGSANLRSLAVYARIDNDKTITWLPSTVKELSMDDSSISYETEFAAPNVESFGAFMLSELGGECVLNYFKFCNLRRLFVNAPGIENTTEFGSLTDGGVPPDESHEHHQQQQPQQQQQQQINAQPGGEAARQNQQRGQDESTMQSILHNYVAQNPLEHVRIVGIPYDQLRRSLISNRLESLIIQEATCRDHNDIIALARACPRLRVCALDMRSVTVYRAFLDCIGAFLNESSVEKFYLKVVHDYIGCFNEPVDWIWDGQKWINFQDVRELDIYKFGQSYVV